MRGWLRPPDGHEALASFGKRAEARFGAIRREHRVQASCVSGQSRVWTDVTIRAALEAGGWGRRTRFVRFAPGVMQVGRELGEEGERGHAHKRPLRLPVDGAEVVRTFNNLMSCFLESLSLFVA